MKKVCVRHKLAGSQPGLGQSEFGNSSAYKRHLHPYNASQVDVYLFYSQLVASYPARLFHLAHILYCDKTPSR